MSDLDRYSLEVIEPPVEEPVTVRFVADEHLKVASGTAEDGYVDRLLRTARRRGERKTGRAWMPQTIELRRDTFPCGRAPLLLERPPLIEVLEIVYVATDGTETVLDPADYIVSGSGRENRKARIAPAYNTIWPATRCEIDAVTITYRAGYVTGGSPEEADVPDDLVHGMLMVVGELYKQRSLSVHTINQNEAVLAADALWQLHKVY